MQQNVYSVDSTGACGRWSFLWGLSVSPSSVPGLSQKAGGGLTLSCIWVLETQGMFTFLLVYFQTSCL